MADGFMSMDLGSHGEPKTVQAVVACIFHREISDIEVTNTPMRVFFRFARPDVLIGTDGYAIDPFVFKRRRVLYAEYILWARQKRPK